MSGTAPALRHAIIGTGGIANAHARALRDMAPRVEIVAAADVDETRVKKFCDSWDIPVGRSSLIEVLAQGDVDVVHLCTPPGVHASQAVEALEAGVHVVCEKPPAMSLAELDDIQAAENRSQASFATVFQHRFGSAAQHLRQLTGGKLGRPLVAVCNTLWFRPDEYFDVPWRGLWSAEGGGPTMGHGIHQFDLLLSILGDWAEVNAASARLARPTNTEDVSAAVVTFDNGAIATIVNSLLSPRETTYLRFDYERATVEVEHKYGYSDDDWVLTPAPGNDDVAADWKSGLTGQASGHSAQFAAVVTALESGERPPVTTDQVRGTVELVAAIYASSFSGQRIRRGDVGADSPFYTSMEGAGTPWPAIKEEQ